MLIRPDSQGVLLIAQPAHAAISGRLARAWGGPHGGRFEPFEEVCLAAEQHDVGWQSWECRPRLNRQTGLPFHAFDLPTPEHVRIWSHGAAAMATQNLYAALLVSLHGTGLYERHDAGGDDVNSRCIRRFLQRQRAFQQEVIEQLREVDAYAAFVDEATIARNRRLIAVWDLMSLRLCRALEEPTTIGDVPAAAGTTAIRMEAARGDGLTWVLDPWPFRVESLALRCDARLLAGRFEDQRRMRRALARAPYRPLTFSLRPR